MNMRTPLGVVALLLMAQTSLGSSTSHFYLYTFGPFETLEHVFFLAGQFAATEDQPTCESLEFQVTSSDPTGFSVPTTTHVSLTPDTRLARLSVGFDDFGGTVLTELSDASVRGGCRVVRRTRVARADGSTAGWVDRDGEAGEYIGFDIPSDSSVNFRPVIKATRFHVIGPGETIELVLFAKYGGAEVTPDSACQGVELTVEISEPLGIVANRIEQISLTPGSLHVIKASSADFGDVILMTTDLRVQGNCDLLTSGRVADEKGETASFLAGGEFPIPVPQG